MAGFRFKCRTTKSDSTESYEIVTIFFDPARLHPNERETLKCHIAWPIDRLPLKTHPDDIQETIDIIQGNVDQSLKLDHPEWWPDDVLDVCKVKIQEGCCLPKGVYDEQGKWEPILVEAEEPNIEGLLRAASRDLDDALYG